MSKKVLITMLLGAVGAAIAWRVPAARRVLFGA